MTILTGGQQASDLRDEPRARVHCRAVFVDAGGVIVLPHRGLVRDALADVQVEVDAAMVGRAHYQAVRRLDRDHATGNGPVGYPRALCRALGVPAERLADAIQALSRLADRSLSEPTPYAQDTLRALKRAGIAVVVVTNSDGHAAENLRDAGICETTRVASTVVTDVIDSALVGSAKPDPEIFRIALQRAKVDARSVVHVGDMVSTDVAGARAAGITPIHFDPNHSCRAGDHRHIRSLASIWRHVVPAPK